MPEHVRNQHGAFVGAVRQAAQATRQHEPMRVQQERMDAALTSLNSELRR